MQKDIEIAKRIAECRDVQAALELARVHYVKEVQKVRAKRRDLTGHCI